MRSEEFKRQLFDQSMVQANDHNFMSIVNSLFYQIVRNDDPFYLKYLGPKPTTEQKEGQCEVQTNGCVYYTPGGIDPIHLGWICPSRTDKNSRDIGFECQFIAGIDGYKPHQQRLLIAGEKVIEKFKQDCNEAFSAVRMPNMRYLMDLELVLKGKLR